jgi:hypothetical protein
MPTASFALSRSEPYVEHQPRVRTMQAEEETHAVLVGVARDRVSDLLRGRLLALRLRARAERVGGALELVAEVLGGRLLRVGLKRGARLVGEALATSCDRNRSAKIGVRRGAQRTVRHDRS